METDDPVPDPLFGHWDRRDVASVAKHGRGPVADLAYGRERDVAADMCGIGRSELGTGQAVESFKLGAAEDEVKGLEPRSVERAPRPLYPSPDFEPALRRRRRYGGTR